MNISTGKETIKKCYSALVNARSELKNYDVNQEFADFAPKFTQTNIDGSVFTLQQMRSLQEDAHKKSHKWFTTLSYEQFDMHGDQATVILFWRDEILFEHPSDVENKRKLVPIVLNKVHKHTWLNIKSAWKLVRCHVLHDTVDQKQPEYVSTNSSNEQTNEVGLPNVVRTNDDTYRLLTSQASNFYNACYMHNDIKACYKINEVEAFARNLCASGNAQACEALKDIGQMKIQGEYARLTMSVSHPVF